MKFEIKYFATCFYILFSVSSFSQGEYAIKISKALGVAIDQNVFDGYKNIKLLHVDGLASRKIKFYGFAEKENTMCAVRVISRESSTSIRFIRTRKRRINSKVSNATRFIDFHTFQMLKNDSLNLQFDKSSGVKLEISGGLTYYVIYIGSEDYCMKKSYKPYFYQERYPTEDRKKFIDMIMNLNSGSVRD